MTGEGSGLVEAPAGLYSVDQLLGGWTADDPLSYGRAFDGRTYLAAVAEGLRIPLSPDVSKARALHDHAITLALNNAVRDRPVVAVMGGHQLGRDDDAYALVAEITWTLAEGHLIVSGGGPGAMEAAHLGARLSGRPRSELDEAVAAMASPAAFPSFRSEDLTEADGTWDDATLRALHAWQAPAFAVAERWSEPGANGDTGSNGLRSIGVPTWLYGHEPPTPLASAHAKYFENSIREDGLLAIAKAGVIFAEGSAGTLQEVFQDAAQNYYGSVDGVRSPMVFLDLDEFWTVRRPVRLLLEGLFDDKQEAILHFVITADDAVAAIRAGGSTPTPSLMR